MSYKDLVIQFQNFHQLKIAALERFIENQDVPFIKITKKENDAIEFTVGFKTYLLVIEPILDKEALIQKSYALYNTYRVTRDLEHYGNHKLTLQSTLRLSGGGAIVTEANAKSIDFPADYLKSLY